MCVKYRWNAFQQQQRRICWSLCQYSVSLVFVMCIIALKSIGWVLIFKCSWFNNNNNKGINTPTMDNFSDDEESIQCMELLAGNYQLYMNWPANSSSASSTAGGGYDGGVAAGGVFHGEGCSASSNSSSVNAHVPINLFTRGGSISGIRGPPSLSPPPPVDVPPISNPLAGNRFWHTIKSRPLIKTAIVR